jgi:hypothetical protein
LNDKIISKTSSKTSWKNLIKSNIPECD